MKNFFKPTEETIRKGNDVNENESEAKETPLTQSISISWPSATLVTFINEGSLLIYFRGNTYIYGGPTPFETDILLDMPLGMYPQDKDVYEKNNSKLQRLSHSPIFLMEHIRRYDGIIVRGKNYVLYRQLEEFMQLSELCSSTPPVIKVEKLIHENQIIAFSQVRNETNGIVRVNIGEDFIDVEYRLCSFSIKDLGYNGKSSCKSELLKEIFLDADRILNYIVEGLSEYNKNLYVQGAAILICALPNSIGWAKTITSGPVYCDDDIEIFAPFEHFMWEPTIIEGKQFENNYVLSIYLLDSLADTRQWLNINIKKMFGYIPNSIELTIEEDFGNFIRFKLKDKDDKNGNAVEFGIGDILQEMDSNNSVKTVRAITT